MPTIYHQFTVSARPPKVFEAFTSLKGLNNWWTLKCSGQQQLGADYNFYFGPEYDWHAEVINMVPDQEFTWLMKEAMDDWKSTEVGFKLIKIGDLTRVNFFHKGWKEESDHFAITNFCWGQLLAGLKNYVEKGVAIPFEKRN